MYLEEFGCIWMYPDKFGCIWFNLDRFGWIWMDLDDLDEFGWIWVDLGGFGWIWMDLDVFWCILMYFDRFGWICMDLDGFREPEQSRRRAVGEPEGSRRWWKDCSGFYRQYLLLNEDLAFSVSFHQLPWGSNDPCNCVSKEWFLL